MLLCELGIDLVLGKLMVIKDGWFGLYVIDGEINVSLCKGDDVVFIIDECVVELLVDCWVWGLVKWLVRKVVWKVLVKKVVKCD